MAPVRDWFEFLDDNVTFQPSKEQAAISKTSLADPHLIDSYGRRVSYLRVSVTDRCDLRCVYCMAEDMTFLPKPEVLTLEELERVCTAFIRRGVRKLRITGGEPLVRRGIMGLFRSLGRHLESGGLDELTLTTNGSHLVRHADKLFEYGVRRINVSLDTLDPAKFKSITRIGNLDRVKAGIEAALDAGLKVKINAVALAGVNENEFSGMVAWCGDRGMDLTFIETMPLGDIGGDRSDQYLSLASVREQLAADWRLEDIDYRSGGPARYVQVKETGCRVGFITPLSHNFCESCNRVRLTCTGTLFMCLGQDDAADLRTPLRDGTGDADLVAAIDAAIAAKPKGHDFVIDRNATKPALVRHMSITGG